MKTSLLNKAQSCLLPLLLLFPLLCAAEQFVQLTAEIEINDWDYWFFTDKIHQYPGEDHPGSIFTQSQTRHCVVGDNTWMIESTFPTSKVTWWFTGTNLVEHNLITKETPEAVVKRLSQISRMAMSSPHVGQEDTHVYESSDGNPGRPVRVADLMGFDLPGNICWLAFCSGSFLKHEGRKINSPSAFWKESSIVSSGWSDQTDVFKDSLGLPNSINLITTNNQSIFQYQVRQSTNLLGWNFPLEFYGVQYLPTGANGWKLHLTIKGKVTAISVGSKPQIPAEVLKAAEKSQASLHW